MSIPMNRRSLIAGAAAGAAACLTGAKSSADEGSATSNAASKTATTASKPLSTRAAVEWPVWDATEENALLETLNSGRWGRTSGGRHLREFEAAFAEVMQAKHCVATASGTAALLTALGALGIGPGDEVIMPPYTFVATFNAITNSYALPIFVDSDPETFQIDHRKIAAAVRPATRVLLPVHIGGSAADLDAILAIADQHQVPVIEDACQAPLAQWRGRPLGTRGLAGCFSFQASKNITSGEGGAVLTNDEAFAHQCYNFHTPGGAKPAASSGRGANYRLTEFQGALLLAQLTRLEAQSRTRDANAAYLTELLGAIPGIQPARLTPGCTRSAWHLYMFRYDKSHFAQWPRAQFLQELAKANIPASAGYSSLNRSKHVEALASNPYYQRIYGAKTMSQWLEANQCPVNDQLCEEAVWFSQTKLLGTRSDMERIAETIAALQKRAA